MPQRSRQRAQATIGRAVEWSEKPQGQDRRFVIARRASASRLGLRMLLDKGLGQLVEVFQTAVRSVGFGRAFSFCYTASVLEPS